MSLLLMKKRLLDLIPNSANKIKSINIQSKLKKPGLYYGVHSNGELAFVAEVREQTHLSPVESKDEFYCSSLLTLNKQQNAGEFCGLLSRIQFSKEGKLVESFEFGGSTEATKAQQTFYQWAKKIIHQLNIKTSQMQNNL